MKSTLIAFVILCFAACSAHVIPEEHESKFDEIVSVAANRLGDEAILVGSILRDVARQLAEEEDLGSETKEYFIKDLWTRSKDAVAQAGKKITDVATKAVNEASSTIKEAAEKAKEKAKEKTFEFLAKIFGKSLDNYAAEDIALRGDFVKGLRARIDELGQKLIKEGQKLRSQ
uniref:Putative secreted protein n=1 Tax=Amblyomma cajennense TaxID=34607 RepID=A0A023FTG8_AMBCJ